MRPRSRTPARLVTSPDGPRRPKSWRNTSNWRSTTSRKELWMRFFLPFLPRESDHGDGSWDPRGLAGNVAPGGIPGGLLFRRLRAPRQGHEPPESSVADPELESVSHARIRKPSKSDHGRIL